MARLTVDCAEPSSRAAAEMLPSRAAAQNAWIFLMFGSTETLPPRPAATTRKNTTTRGLHIVVFFLARCPEAYSAPRMTFSPSFMITSMLSGVRSWMFDATSPRTTSRSASLPASSEPKSSS